LGRDLEAPFANGSAEYEALYRARGDEVSPYRPIFTGDIFTGIELPGRTGSVKKRSVMIVQHPCSMRADGVNLAWQVLVAEVTNRTLLDEAGWQGNYALMPLPDLMPDSNTASRHQAASFDNLYTVSPAVLTDRIASLSPFGVNLVLQRWVHFSARVIVPTETFQRESAAYYEEADLLEEWSESFDEVPITDSAKECVEWLREDVGTVTTRQDMLKNPQAVSAVRHAMRDELKKRLAAGEDTTT
jgi:hypothetical protein